MVGIAADEYFEHDFSGIDRDELKAFIGICLDDERAQGGGGIVDIDALASGWGLTFNADQLLHLLRLFDRSRGAASPADVAPSDAPAAPPSVVSQDMAPDRPTPRNTTIDLNSATKTALTSLPGIGRQTAAAIIDHRPFMSIDDLAKVPGIGRGNLEKVVHWCP